MDILVIGSRSFPPIIGGIERYVYEFSKKASEMGHHVTLIVQRHKGEKSYEKIGNIEVIRCYATHIKPLDRFIMMFQTMVKRVKDYDVYWGHGTVGIGIHHLKPYAYTIHGFGFMREDVPPILTKFIRWFEFKILEYADTKIAVDKQSYDMANSVSSNIHLIENGIDLDRFERKYPDPYDTDVKNILYVGRLVESKGILDLMDAVDKMEDVCLHIVGSGPLESQVQSRAEGKIKFHGKVDVVEGYFQHADVFVLSSYHEGFPTTVLETMAARVPCVITSLPAFEGNFTHEREVLFYEPGDVSGLTECLRRVLEDDTLAKDLTRRAYIKVKKEYSWEAKTKEILKLFEDCIERNRC